MSSFDVVIVGAGAAGITAARHLAAAQLRVVVLEARHRVGGRAVTDHSLGVPLDLGAAWLHFATENPWTAIADQAALGVIRREPGWGAATNIGAHSPTIEERATFARDYARYDELIVAAADRDISLADVLPQDSFRARFDATMTWSVGTETRRISTMDLARYADSTHNWAVRDGLGTTVAAGAAELPVRLGCTVSAIDWSGPLLRVDSNHGRLESRAVIVTLPTAVLAQGALQFTPALPSLHMEAFHGIPLGVANKVFFELRNNQLADGISRHFIGRANTSRTCSYLVRPAEQPLLCAYFGGDLSRELEQRHELAQFAREELRGIFGADFMNQLGSSIVTAWGTDPLARGSYSAALPGKAHCREILAAPVTPQLLFAGEANSMEHYGTLHGAWQSGAAAAAQVIAALSAPRPTARTRHALPQ